jgi:hypothetical protein
MLRMSDKSRCWRIRIYPTFRPTGHVFRSLLGGDADKSGAPRRDLSDLYLVRR